MIIPTYLKIDGKKMVQVCDLPELFDVNPIKFLGVCVTLLAKYPKGIRKIHSFPTDNAIPLFIDISVVTEIMNLMHERGIIFSYSASVILKNALSSSERASA